MIDIIKQTPIEYSAQSRDYQVLARLYTALFNISKMYIDNLQIWTNDIDNKLATLRAKTLNFDIKRAWDENDLEAVTDCFKYLMRHKGTLKVIEYCVNILMKIQGIVGETLSDPISIDNYIITIRVPETLLTLGVLEDLLSHILPAGYIFNIIRYKSTNISGLLNTELIYADGDIKYTEVPYNKDMYVSPSTEVTLWQGIVTKTTQLQPEDKYWLRLKNDQYVPDDNLTKGLESATLIANLKEDQTEEEIELSKTGSNKATLTYEQFVKKGFKPNMITNTLVYRGTNDLGPTVIENEEANYEQWREEED